MTPMMETLEGRQLFALVVPGTPGADFIQVTDIAGPTTRVQVNNFVWFAADAGFNNIMVNAFAGNDRVYIYHTKQTIVRGGTGDDTILGGAGNDILYGEDGNDWINGRDGSDYLHGGNGNDYLVGAAGRDTMVGWAGVDRYAGNVDGALDRIYRNAFTDFIVGGTDAFDVVTHVVP